ncbi:MAG: hypothetical protein PHI12_12520 [Dehalococcoidales bacterium]|nr:hypothetical protein [Dehalococcoidales bacterium]
MSDMRWTFSDLYTNVAEFLGLGSSPTGSNLTMVKNYTYRGYMKLLTEMNPALRRRHPWSFLKKSAQLITSDGVYKYGLPEDFWCLVDPVNFDSDDGYAPLTKVSREYIKRLRAATTYESVPTHVSVGSGDYSPSTKQGGEIWLYPTPNKEYKFQYDYTFMPEKPTSDSDYFVGGPEVSEGIRLCALAVAEAEEDEIVDGPMQRRAAAYLLSLMMADMTVDTPDTVGPMRNGSAQSVELDNRYVRSIRDLQTWYDDLSI